MHHMQRRWKQPLRVARLEQQLMAQQPIAAAFFRDWDAAEEYVNTD
jgi:hypothetical protein